MNTNIYNNLALCLSGGAARGAFHLGILSFLEEEKIEISAYSGSSIGAIIAASHASGVCAKEQLKIFTSKEIKKALKFNYFKNGLIKIDHKHNILKEILPIEKLEDIPKTLFVNAYDIKKKQMHYFDNGDTLSLCMASSALTPLFKPISYKNMYLIDGGLIDNIPIKPLLDKNYNICSIDLLPRLEKSSKKSINPIKIIKRKIFSTWHKNVTFSISNSNYYISTLALRDYKMFTFNGLEECYKLGYKEAIKHFKEI